MIFCGQYRYSLDEKKRVIVPAKFREAAGAEGLRFQITTVEGTYMRMYTNSVWAQITNQLTANPLPDTATLNLQTLLYGQADEVDCDKQGRIMLRKAAEFGIEREVVFLGVSNHIQIWSPERYEIMIADLRKNSEALTQQLQK